MNKSRLGLAGVLAALTLSACATANPALSTDTASPSVSTSASAAVPLPTTTDETPATEAPISTVPPTAPPGTYTPDPGGWGSVNVAPSTVPADQTTPEGVAMMFLKALANGDANAACTIMAADGRPLSTIGAGAVSVCVTNLSDMAKNYSATLKSKISEISVKGATTDGHSAIFDNAIVAPEEAKTALQTVGAINVNNKWYVQLKA